MKRYLLPILLVLLSSCDKIIPDDDPEVKDPTAYYANLFAFNIMYTYYLWADEEIDAIESWTYADDPIEKVASLRYKDANGNLVDRWTELMEDCSSFVTSVTGNGKTFGMDFVLLRYGENGVVMEITYTYANSPARKAGLKRGDVVTSVDGQELTMDNYADLLTEKVYDFPETIKLGMLEGDNVQMSAVDRADTYFHGIRSGFQDGLCSFVGCDVTSDELAIGVGTFHLANGIDDIERMTVSRIEDKNICAGGKKLF